MNDGRLEDAFAPMPDVVREHIDKALTEVKIMNQRHRKPWVAVALVFALMLALAGGAVAAGFEWRSLDFLSRGYNAGQALPEVRELVQTEITQTGGVTAEAVFTAQEAICDGRNAFIMFEVRPVQEDTLLVLGQRLASAPASRFDPELPEDVSMAEWAEENGYARILAIRMTHDDNQKDGFDWGQTSVHRQEDGSYQIMLQGTYRWLTAQEMSFQCHTVTRWTKESGKPRRETVNLTATIQPGPEPLWQFEWEGQVAIPDADCVVEKIAMTGTAIATYTEITYKGQAPLGTGMVYLVDEDGQSLKWSAGTGVSWETEHFQKVGVADPISMGKVRCSASYEPMESPPEVLRVSITTKGDGTKMAVIPFE